MIFFQTFWVALLGSRRTVELLVFHAGLAVIKASQLGNCLYLEGAVSIDLLLPCTWAFYSVGLVLLIWIAVCVGVHCECPSCVWFPMLGTMASGAAWLIIAGVLGLYVLTRNFFEYFLDELVPWAFLSIVVVRLISDCTNR